jgi:methanogenic corrinoid protein MtbC1
MAESLIYSFREGLRSSWPRLRIGRRSVQDRSITYERISAIVEGEIIPRLNRNAAESLIHVREATEPEQLAQPDVCAVTHLILKQDVDRAWHFVEELHLSGWPLEQIYLELLAPVARLLGELWEADHCDFSAVTLGTGYLQQLLRELSLRYDKDCALTGHHHRVMLLPATGEQHSLGLSILGELFRRDGWDVCGGPAVDRVKLQRLLSGERFDVVGFSISADRWLESLADDIAAVRSSSTNEDIRIMVGGGAIARDPALVSQLGADLSATDGHTATRAALTGTQSIAIR